MKEFTKGEWVKYEKQPEKWKDALSYTRLRDDLEEHKDTEWTLTDFVKYISSKYSHKLSPNYDDTPNTSDIYVYCTNDKSGKRKPKIYLAVYKDSDGINVDVFGTRKRNPISFDFEPQAKYLSIILEKLQELNVKESVIEEYEKKLNEYQSLVSIAKDGIKTSKDILTIYRNLPRTDTTIEYKLIKGRDIQADYNSLNEEDKIKFIEIICEIEFDYIVKKRFDLLTNNKLSVTDINILKKTINPTKLLSLRFAPKEYRENKEILLEILSDYNIKKYDIFGAGLFAISKDLQTDLDIIAALIRTDPPKIKYILVSYIGCSELFQEKSDDLAYISELLNMYLKSIISNPSYLKEKSVPMKIIWLLRPDFIDNIESKLLCGPFRTLEEEEMKRIAYNELKLERTRSKR